MLNLDMTRLARTILLAASVAYGVTSVTPLSASAPMAKFSAPGFFRLMVGEFELTVLSDGTADIPMDQLLHQKPAKTKAALRSAFLKSPLETSFNSYLINTGDKLVLIDTGAGSLFGPTLGKLVANLKAAGYQPEQIDEIYLTHLHPDHVGGLVSGGQLAFPNATVRADQRDSEYWLSQANLEHAAQSDKGFFQGAMASLKPYVDANKFKPFTSNTELVPGIKSISTYGHSAGHTSYLVESKGSQVLVVGDLIHVPAVQLENPSVSIAFDADPRLATEVRAKTFNRIAADGTLVGAAHIQFPGLGHLRRSGTAYQWVPVNFTQMR